MKKNESIGKALVQRYIEQGRIDPNLSKNSIKVDRWDERDLESIVNEMASFKEARRQLGNFAPKSGESLMADDFYSLVKAVPKRTPSEEMEPSHLLNGMVIDEAMALPEYLKLHRYATADPIQAGASAVSMEPKLEEIFDRLKTAQEQLQDLIDQMEQHQEYAEELEGIEAELEAIAAGGGGTGDEDQNGNPQEQKALIEEQMRRLEKQMDNTASEMDEEIEEEQVHIQHLLRQGFEEANEEAQTAESAAIAWGLDPGGLKRLPPERRIELAEKLNSEKFRRIADLFGPMTRLAMSEQNRKVYYASDEIFDIEIGNDLARMLPSEMIRLHSKALRPLWVRDYIQSGLQLYKLQGVEKVAKGSIILCEDGSGSMGGASEIWAKAVALCLARITREQKRDFHAIHFGGTGEYYEFEFEGAGFDGKVNTYASSNKARTYPNQTFNYIDGIIHFAEVFFGGGTDFMTPLSRALQIQQEQFEAKGRVEGDIVFVTDGMCGVDQGWLDAFKEEQERLGFRVWGIIIGGWGGSEPLNTITDGRCFTIQDLTSGEEMRDIFRNL
jgi:uncharacterized protein with von Willebrand factor type A (vWA) domain